MTAAVSVAPSPRPSTCFRPAVSIPNRNHHAMVPEDLAIDADHPQVQLAQRPAEKRLEALRRQRHEPPRNCAARRRPLRSRRPAPGPTCPRTGASTPRRRPRPACARSAGRWPPPTGSSPAVPRRPRSAPGAAAPRPAARRASPDSPHSRRRHAGRSTWWRPFGPHSTARTASIIASRTCSPVAMHKPWNASRTPCTTPEHRQRHLNRDGSRVRGVGRTSSACHAFAMGGSLLS